MNRLQTVESYKSLDEDLQRYINELDETALRLILTNSHPAVCQFCGKEASDNPYCCKDYENFLRILHPEEHLVGKFLSRISGQYHFHRSSEAARGRKETEQLFDPWSVDDTV